MKEIFNGVNVIELSVIKLAVNNYSNVEIAFQLGVKNENIETHKKSLMQKIRVSNTRELISKLLELGYLKSNPRRMPEGFRMEDLEIITYFIEDRIDVCHILRPVTDIEAKASVDYVMKLLNRKTKEAVTYEILQFNGFRKVTA